MLACADLNLPASNYAPIFPNRSTVSPAPSDDEESCWRVGRRLLYRSRAPKTTAIVVARAINVDRASTPVSPLKSRSFTDRSRARAACAPALRENKLDWGRKEREGGEGEEGTGFLRPKDSFQASSVRQLGMGKNERRGRERERERRGARLIFYLGGDLASRARILAFIDPDNHSPVSASSVLRSRERIRVAPGPLLLPPPPPSLLPPFAYLRLQLMLSRGKHPSETGMASSYSAESVSVGELARCATT